MFIRMFYIRILGHFAPIFYFNCEHVLILYTVYCKTKTNKNFADFIKNISWIFKIVKNRIFLDETF